MTNFEYDVVVIGGGPGGYNCAIRAAQLGFKTACIEGKKLGGTCLNVGCIPSKSLLESSSKYHSIKKGWLEEFGLSVPEISFDMKKVMQKKDEIVSSLCSGVAFLLKANEATHIQGFASFVDKNTITVKSDSENKKITSKYFIIATGSYPVCIKGHEFDEKIILSSDSGVNLTAVPKEMIIIGAGVIGLELGSVWSRFGAKVTILEYLDKVAPTMDEDASKELMKLLQKQGIEFKLGVGVNKIVITGTNVKVHYTNNSDKKEEEIGCDKVLVSIGRAPNTKNLNLESVKVKLNERGYVITDNALQTNIENIFAIGDVTTGPMLAHKAEEDGIIAVEYIARLEKDIKNGRKDTVKLPLHHDSIPAVIYTHPEVASIGKTEQDLKKEGIEYNVSKIPFSSNGRAKTMRETDGFVKLLCDKNNNYVLGAHIVHAFAGSMINELSAYMIYKASPDDIALTVHSHPDLNEVIRAAALDILGKPLSSVPKKIKTAK